MTNLQRRIQKLEAHLLDPSGIVPQTQPWLEYWDRQIYEYAMAAERSWPPVLFPLEAVRAVMQYRITLHLYSDQYQRTDVTML
jgi:hypothetical protein